MKAILLLFDSLNRHLLPCYGGDWVKAPNFQRLAERSVTFDNAYMGSMPCMPARRELHTGRYNFLHRIWGPLEPFDDSMPELLKKAGVYTHLITDHFHYFEDGGSTYHNRYNSWEFFRGQEGDPWKAHVAPPQIPAHLGNRQKMPLWRQDWVNRTYMTREEDLPLARNFQAGLEFLDVNHGEDNWFLQLENFSPHEPFHVPESYLQQYDGPELELHFEWPDYAAVTETPEAVAHCRKRYAALVTMCDQYLGRLLDRMDRYNLWEDTLLIVGTDHGVLLGEHGWWGKRVCSNYNEIAHIPMWVWDPRCAKKGERRQSLVQTIDLAPTLLEYFGQKPTADMQGRPLRETVERDTPVRDMALFGLFGGQVNCTDGRYLYMKAPVVPYGEELYQYTLVPMFMGERFAPSDFKDWQIAEPFSFTKGCPLWKLPSRPRLQKPFLQYEELENRLYDLQTDPGQQHPLHDPELEAAMRRRMVGLMQESDAPVEQYRRLGLEKEAQHFLQNVTG